MGNSLDEESALLSHSNEGYGSIMTTTTTLTQTTLDLPGDTPSSIQPSSSNTTTALPSHTTRLQQVVVIIQLFAVTLTPSVVNGLVTVGLPTITKDLQLPKSLEFWPASVSSLATASTLLLAGSIADAVGPRWVELVGSFAGGVLMIGQGLSRNGEELVAMRAIQGVGSAFHLSSSVALITQILPPGKGRNMAFSCLGLSQPLGFSLGLVLGGVLIDATGWRTGWYLAGGTTLFFTTIGLWALPKTSESIRYEGLWYNITTKVDWVGAGLASAFMALLCYLLAILSANPSRIQNADSIAILCLALLAIPSFILWAKYRVNRNKPALIPNSLWKNRTFSSICATIALSFAVVNAMELFASLFFQEIQNLSALQASIRILPSLIVGMFMNLSMGFFVHKVPAVWIVTVTSVLCAISPLLMAVVVPESPYWGNAFVAQLLQPVSCDALFTVGLIVITDIFPSDTHAVAGAVFNTTAQFGMALGLAVLQVISTTVTGEIPGGEERERLMRGYRASFWTMFGFMVLCTLVGFVGLRNAGRVGLKRD